MKAKYDPQNAKEKPTLPADSVLDGVIYQIEDGLVRDFVAKTEKWTGDINSPAINVIIEVMVESVSIKIAQLFTYETDGNQTVFSQNSNLGRFKHKYGSLPSVGNKVKVQTDGKGFGKIKLD
jgi:hypothetical protein